MIAMQFNSITFIAWVLFQNTYQYIGTVTAHNHDDHNDHDSRHSDSSHNHVRHLKSNGSSKRCDAREPTHEESQTASKIVEKYMAKKLMLQKEGRQTSPSVAIGTYFHVITDGTAGTVTNEQLLLQLQVLNDSYNPHGFTFQLLGNTTTNNAIWFNATKDEEAEMMQSLRTGDGSTLNIFVKNPSSGSILGRSTFPWSYSSNPEKDAVVVKYSTLPLGSEDRFSDGKTLVHEVGHWLGLYHTFQENYGRLEVINQILFLLKIRSNCNTGDGDGVSDTPRQRSPTYGCPIGRDSCPLAPGLDSINNYMDYSTDACLILFTPGQQDRMVAMWEEYRAN